MLAVVLPCVFVRVVGDDCENEERLDWLSLPHVSGVSGRDMDADRSRDGLVGIYH